MEITGDIFKNNAANVFSISFLDKPTIVPSLQIFKEPSLSKRCTEEGLINAILRDVHPQPQLSVDMSVAGPVCGSSECSRGQTALH